MSHRVLVIEDNELNMKLFCDILESAGYESVKAYSGLAALQLAPAHQWSLFIVDIQLPDISGIEVARELKSNPLLSRVPILAVTAFAMKGDEEKFLAAGCDAYIAKPIVVTDFLDTVGKLVSSAGSESGSVHLPRDNRDLD